MILILLFSRIFPQLTVINTDLNIIVANVPSVKLVMQLDDDLPDPVARKSGVTDEEIMSVLEQVKAAHLVKRFRKGLDAFVVNYPFTFSGGECQRLALARVLLRRPVLLLLDEATSLLDPENEAIIMEVLARLKERITIVFVTHRESAARWFDEIIKI